MGLQIIIRDKEESRKMGLRAFMSEVSKGSARPAFCNPEGISRMEETVRSMEKTLDNGYVASHNREKYRIELEKHKRRVSELKAERDMAQAVYENDKEYWDKQAAAIEKEVTGSMPTKKQVKERMVNPHSVLKAEQSGMRDKKLLFQAIQKLRDGDSDLSYLQKG